MLPTEKGSYQARPLRWRVGTSKNGAVEFAVEFNLYGQWDGAANWNGCNYDITGYFYLVTKDGSVNEKTVEQVETVFGWDRRTGVSALANSDQFPDCQVFCDFEAGQDGGQRIKVKWLNPFDKVPGAGIGTSDPQEISNIDARFGALLRGSSPKKGPVQQPNRPTNAPPANSNGGATAAASALNDAKRAAWEAFKAMTPGTTQEQQDGFRAALHDYFHGKPAAGLGAAQWEEFRKNNFRKVVENPISDEPVFADSDVPF